ncbi:hypothetical protein [Polaribacter glomeratus]|uniref:Chemotaxis methyl-accepting receptor HlyB-like 4HB MCP domain-containing protein n=1 Tax=Polaribacter glomeratus TaxID=102 RepID=A0A2S7WV30_9FLAO|nr:hypothetical protein [Polaribacter glomeratus]PQJ81408.1 hypothetical protein BTO16_01915 [Polaribacter glomeratus]TXD64792.1 hypothetical protein ESX12_13325 [Polaribacter glomeratus]
MATNFTSYNRINIGLALTIVFLLVYATNRIDNKHFETVQNALVTLHTDRIIAQDFIYKMNTIAYEKQLHYIDESHNNVHKNLNTDFYTLLEDFSNTKLTLKEATIFDELKIDFDKLILSEKKGLLNSTKKDAAINSLNTIKKDLINLSEIQISESKHLTSLAQKSLDTNNLISKFEIGFLILIGLLIQFTIFYRVKKSEKS